MLADAMTAHPEMVSGERRSDLALTRAGRGDWVCKIGAEGVQAIGMRSRGLGIAIKVADGNKRGLAARQRSQCWTSSDCSTQRRRAELADWFEPVVAQLSRHRHRARSAVVVLDKADRPLDRRRSCIAITLVEMNLPSRNGLLRASARRRPRMRPGQGPGRLGLRPAAAPAVRQDNNE